MKNFHLILFIFLLVYLGEYSFAQDEIITNGYNKFYYPNGKLLSEGYMKDGKPEGYWKTYYTTGIIKSEGNRKNFLLDSLWIFYNSTGDTLNKINYLLGKKNGFYYEYFTDRSRPEYIGKIKSKELYIADKLQGLSYYYYENGALKETIVFNENKKDGISLEFDKDDRRIITIKRYMKGNLAEREKINRYNSSNQKDGTWKIFYEGIKVKNEANYRNGNLHGYYKEYDEHGILILTLLYDDGKIVTNEIEENIEIIVKEKKTGDGKYVDRGPYIDEIPVGIHKRYDSNGNITESWIYDDKGILLAKGIVDREGKRQGDWIDYYRNGSVKSSGKYKDNLREGPWRFYFSNGNVEQVGSYISGKEHGVWKWYYTSGEIWIEEEFYNGKEEGLYTEYDILGNILAEGEYFDGEREGAWIVSINDFRAKGNYVTGFRDGKWRYYYDDQTVMFDGSYIQGQPDGKHKYYFSDGSLKEEQYYVNGIPDKHWKKFDIEGNLIVTITYEDGKEYRINGVKIDLPDDNTVIIK